MAPPLLQPPPYKVPQLSPQVADIEKQLEAKEVLLLQRQLEKLGRRWDVFGLSRMPSRWEGQAEKPR
jgi:uncharacterized membrane protein YgcG